MDIRQKAPLTLKRLWAAQAMAPVLSVCEVYYIEPHIHPGGRGFLRPPFSCGVSVPSIYRNFPTLPQTSISPKDDEHIARNYEIGYRYNIPAKYNQPDSVRSKRTNVKCEHSARTFSHFSNTSPSILIFHLPSHCAVVLYPPIPRSA